MLNKKRLLKVVEGLKHGVEVDVGSMWLEFEESKELPLSDLADFEREFFCNHLPSQIILHVGINEQANSWAKIIDNLPSHTRSNLEKNWPTLWISIFKNKHLEEGFVSNGLSLDFLESVWNFRPFNWDELFFVMISQIAQVRPHADGAVVWSASTRCNGFEEGRATPSQLQMMADWTVCIAKTIMKVNLSRGEKDDTERLIMGDIRRSWYEQKWRLDALVGGSLLSPGWAVDVLKWWLMDAGSFGVRQPFEPDNILLLCSESDKENLGNILKSEKVKNGRAAIAIENWLLKAGVGTSLSSPSQVL